LNVNIIVRIGLESRMMGDYHVRFGGRRRR